MNSHVSHKIIAASGMAAVIGIGVLTFALRSDPITPVAQPALPHSPVAQIPAPDTAAFVPAAPAAVAHDDSVGTKSADTAAPSAVEPMLARNTHVGKAASSAVATNGTVTRTGPAADTGDEPATETVANNVERVTNADELTTKPTTGGSPAAGETVGSSSEFTASDSQITADVKSAIAGDSLSKNFSIGVTTIRGVVVLSGSLASQDDIDYAKEVAGKVKGVKSVDTSALILASL